MQDQLKRKDYKVVIDHDDVNLLSWNGVMPYMGMDTDKMGVMYTYFSLYAHPSNVAVFQYGDLFEITKDEYTQMSNFNVATGVKLVSFFLAD